MGIGVRIQNPLYPYPFIRRPRTRVCVPTARRPYPYPRTRLPVPSVLKKPACVTVSEPL
jgi:hypothetical protein